MKKFHLYAALILALAAASFATDTMAGPNNDEEMKVGKNADKFIRKHFGAYKDEKVQKYVSDIGQKLLESISDPEFEFHFLVLDDPMLNAFAVPGGYIYITRGMLAYLNSEAALAGVIGHEIGHVIGHHSYKQMKKSLGDALLVFAGLGAAAISGGGSAASAWAMTTSSLSAMSRAGYGRELENQADEFGMIYAYDAGWDPREQSKFFSMLQFKERVSGSGYHGFLATHPDTIMRIITTRQKSEIIASRGKPMKVNRNKFLKILKGLPYGKKGKRSGLPPPHVLDIYTVRKGDSFRSIALEKSGDEALAFEIAVMNNMRLNNPLTAGTLLKVPVKRKPQPENILKK